MKFIFLMQEINLEHIIIFMYETDYFQDEKFFFWFEAKNRVEVGMNKKLLIFSYLYYFSSQGIRYQTSQNWGSSMFT